MSVNGISLTSSMNQSLQNLNNTTNNLNKSLQSLSTGQKNRSTDPTRFSMAQSLLSQMSDIADKKDSMTNSITAGNMAQAGYEGVTSLLRSAQGVVSAAQSTSDPNSQANYAASYQNIVDQANQMASDAGISSSALPLIPPNNLNANSTSQLATSITALHGEAAASASSLATTPILQAFSDSMMNTLQSGADNLTLTDLNEQAASVLMQQTQQQLGIASIGMSAKSAQSVLKQFA